MRTHHLPSVLLIIALLAGLAGTVARDAGPALASAPALGPAAHPAGVPAEYADLYPVLAAKLRAIDSYITSRSRGEQHDTLFSAELLAANSNQGETLLRPQAWPVVVLNLDRLQLVGVRGVKVAIKYPILVPGFPRSAEYLEFFKRLSAELKKRNLKFLAQMTPGFREPAFSSLPVAGYYIGLTLERYMRETRQMAEVIIREIRPDYLTIVNEPHTAQENTGLPFTVGNFTGVVQHVLNGLDRAGVLVGAGAGTWDDLAYAQSLARTTLDYLDMHIYPINQDYVIDKAIRFADIARRANKKVVLGEAWLYKTRDQELRGQAVAAAPALFARDIFSFWEPLDVEFIAVVGKLSHFLSIDRFARQAPPFRPGKDSARCGTMFMRPTPPTAGHAGSNAGEIRAADQALGPGTHRSDPARDCRRNPPASGGGGCQFTSFFWSRHFYGYVEYGETTKGLRPAELFRQANLAAARNMMADPPQPTRTGTAFQRLVTR